MHLYLLPAAVGIIGVFYMLFLQIRDTIIGRRVSPSTKDKITL